MRESRRRSVSNATVNRELQYLGQAYNLRAKEIGPGPSIPKARTNGCEKDFTSGRSLRPSWRHLPEDLQDFARWGYFTGWRKGEISSLRWNELNMENRQLRLRGPVFEKR